MATVELESVRKFYGRTEAIKGIDLAVEDGEFLVLLGPSGCGKSTLLRMVAGLEDITEGDIRIDGRIVNRLEPKERDIAMVFQNYALYPHMTVFDNMAYGLRIRGTPKPEIAARVAKVAEVLELGPYLARKPSQLSGGQRQRVAMGRAIIREPKVFLFDEPLSNLDAKLRHQMRVEIKRLQERLGVTSLYVTHDQVEAMTLAHRIVVMNHGVAEQIGTPIEVYLTPATLFVATFIGSPAMNILDASVCQDGAHVALDGNEPVPLPGRKRLPAGKPVRLGVRPEHLAPYWGKCDGGPEFKPGIALFRITVELTEALGASTLVHGRLGDGTALTAMLPGIPEHASGSVLILAAAVDNLHLFDADTGRRLID